MTQEYIYAVTSGEYSDYSVHFCMPTREAAQQWIDEHDDEFDLKEIPLFVLPSDVVRVEESSASAVGNLVNGRLGAIEHSYTTYEFPWSAPEPTVSVQGMKSRNVRIIVHYARGKEAAVKAIQDKWAEVKAAHAGL